MKSAQPRVAPIRRICSGTAIVLPAVLAGLLVAAPAMAQSANAEAVESRPRPEYDPLGIYLDDALRALGQVQVGRGARPTRESGEAMGSFMLNTTMELDASYDDNIYRKATGQVSDTILRFKPGLKLASDWANHALNFTVGGDIGRYTDRSSEDFSDFNAGVSGKVDIDEGHVLDLGLSWARGHEARDSIDNTDSAKPTTSQNFNFNAVYNRDTGSIFSRTTASVSYADFFDNGTVNHDDRDVRTYTLRQRLGHDIDEGSQFFVEGSANLRDFVASVDDAGKKLGSHGYEGLVGLVWDVSGITFVEFGAGYLLQDFDDPSSRNEKGPAFRGRFLWNPTGLLTLSGGAEREVKDTTQAGASGVTTSIYSLKLDWEALYNLILTLDTGYTTEVTGGTNRSDDTSRMAFRWRWLVGQNWSLRGAVEYQQRESTQAGSDYSNLRLSVGVVERL